MKMIENRITSYTIFYFAQPSFVVRRVVNLNPSPFTCNIYQIIHNQDKDKNSL